MSSHIDCPREAGILVHFIVHVRRAFRPGRWAWYAVDCESGEIVEYEFEYDSPWAARHAGVQRLEEIASYLKKTPRRNVIDVAPEVAAVAGAESLPVKLWPGPPSRSLTRLAKEAR